MALDGTKRPSRYPAISRDSYIQPSPTWPLPKEGDTVRELWGEKANPNDTVCLDLWESCLEPA